MGGSKMIADTDRPNSVDFVVNPEHRPADVDSSDPVDVLQAVEAEMERREVMLARREAVARGDETVSMTSRIIKNVVLMVLVPCFMVALVWGLVEVSMAVTLEEAFTLKFFGLVVVSTVSYLGSMFIIASHFLHPELWSERRQQMMFSSWPAMMHYGCLIYEAAHSADCQHDIAVLRQISFLSQMMWQVAVAHGIFRYIQFEKPVLTGSYAILRHFICWGLPIAIYLTLAATNPNAYVTSVDDPMLKVESPWCGISGDTSVRGAKAVFIHAPQMIGVVFYGYFYFYIANWSPAGSYWSKSNAGDRNFALSESRISTSPHQDLQKASHDKRMLDISRAAANLRHCMAAFMMTYLMQTMMCVYAEHFDLGGKASEIVLLARIYMVTPQQFIYAAVFSSQKAGSVVGHFLSFHTATIKSSKNGAKLADVNTTVNKFILQSKVKAEKKSTLGENANRAHVPEGIIGGHGSSSPLTQVTSLMYANQYKGIKKGLRIGAIKRKLQALLFVPLALFVWVPIYFMRQHYTTKLSATLIGCVGYAILLLFPFTFFQGTRDNEAEKSLSASLVVVYVGSILLLTLVGVYKNRHNPNLLVVDDPRPTVRASARSVLAYMTIFIEFFQLPILALSAARLTDRYRSETAEDSRPNELSLGGLVVSWTVDDLFLIQYPLAVMGVVCWVLVFAISQAIAMVYRKPVDGIIAHAQIVLFGLSGPGYLFITKNLMKGLFCISDLDDPGRMMLSAQKELDCWSPRHLTYCTVSLFGLCAFLPSATLTNAIKFSEPEDVRYVYYFLKIELFLKGCMVFVALSTQGNKMFALTFLIIGSMAISGTIKLMEPSNLKHINRLKYLIHTCSVWMCLTCIWAEKTDNKNWQLHLGIVVGGWLCFMVALALVEMKRAKADVLKMTPTEAGIAHCVAKMDFLQAEIVRGAYICGTRVSWTTHSHILRLLKFAVHKDVQISKKSFETLAVLSYLDQMTEKDAFFAFAPSTCMDIFCRCIVDSTDEGTKSFAIRVLKTFLQEELYAPELEALLSSGRKIAEPLADVVQNSSRPPLQIDACICLLAMCGIDSNQLKSVLPILPTLNSWMESGQLISQHLALELLANLSSRSDVSETIVTAGSLPHIFELFCAIDDATARAADLKPNTGNGFRKGFGQPAHFSNLAHQLPRNVIHDFSAQYSSVKRFLEQQDEGPDDEAPMSVEIEDFLAWMNSGNVMSEKIKGKMQNGDIADLAASFKSPKAIYGPEYSLEERLSNAQYTLLFNLIDDDGSGDLDEGEIAEFLEGQGLGKREEIKEILLDTGLRLRGISEMNDIDESIDPDQFRRWLREGSKKDGLASKMILACLEPIDDEFEQLSDVSIDALFNRIDDDGGGTLDAEEIADFLEAEGLGGKKEMEEVLKQEMVGRSVTDTVVQLSAKQTQIMKNEMLQYALHIIMECAGVMTGLGRRKMIMDGVLDIILRALQPDRPVKLRVTGLQALHALSSDRFSLEDVMADEEFEGYYGDCLQLAEEEKASPGDEPVLILEDLSMLQRRKVHIVAQFAKMEHESSGPPDSRIVTVTPPKAQDTYYTNPIDAVSPAGAPVIELPEDADPFARSLYNNNRTALAAAGVVPVLCEIIATCKDAFEVTFNALDCLVVFVEHDNVPQAQVKKVFDVCCLSMKHTNIGVAVLSAYPLEAIVLRKQELFAATSGIKRFRKAVRVVIIVYNASTGVKHDELDLAVQKSRSALR